MSIWLSLQSTMVFMLKQVIFRLFPKLKFFVSQIKIILQLFFEILGSVMVSIDITDVNDNTPVIQTSTTVINVKEGMPVGSKIAKIDASDQDIGANGEIRFSIKNHDDEMIPFDINEKTGDISITKGM